MMRLMMAWIVALCISGMMATGVAAGRPEGKELVPAAEDTATAALVKSPRHGEWVDVPMGEGEIPVRTWVVYPERAGAAPVVVVIHEIFGLTDWIRAVSDALAAEGYVAVAPDLLSGKGPDGGGTKVFAGDAVRAAVQGLSNDEVVRRLDAVRTYALKMPATSMKSAVVGFCWGGSTTFTYAMKQAGQSFTTAPAMDSCGSRTAATEPTPRRRPHHGPAHWPSCGHISMMPQETSKSLEGPFFFGLPKKQSLRRPYGSYYI